MSVILFQQSAETIEAGNLWNAVYLYDLLERCLTETKNLLFENNSLPEIYGARLNQLKTEVIDSIQFSALLQAALPERWLASSGNGV